MSAASLVAASVAARGCESRPSCSVVVSQAAAWNWFDDLAGVVRPVPGEGPIPGSVSVGRPAYRPVRLTARGRIVMALLAAAVLVGGFVAVDGLLGAGPVIPASAPAGVVVRPGDTLWGIARQVAPERDARVVVAEIRRLNELSDPDIRPGQVLRLRRE